MQIRQRNVAPGVTYHSVLRSRAKVMEAVSAGDLLYVSGIDGQHLELSKADAATFAKVAGRLFVARAAVGSGVAGRALDIALPRLIQTGVNTSGGAVGSPIYAKDGGGWSISAGTFKRLVGWIVAVDATAGAVEIDPQADFSYLVASGQMSITSGDNGSVALGAAFANCTVVATAQSLGTGPLYVETAIADGSGNVTITLDAANTAGTTVVNWLADAR